MTQSSRVTGTGGHAGLPGGLPGRDQVGLQGGHQGALK